VNELNTPGQMAKQRTPELARSITGPIKLPRCDTPSEFGILHCTVINPEVLRQTGVTPETVETHCLVEGDNDGVNEALASNHAKWMEVCAALVPLVAAMVTAWR
jgi:hypothetical protein